MILRLAGFLTAIAVLAFGLAPVPRDISPMREHQLTNDPSGKILTHCNVWSADSQWIAFDTRSDAAGDRFDGSTIRMVNVNTREIRTLYKSKNGANCGVVTWHPTEPKVIFILGPENPTPEWSYEPSHRQGVIVDVRSPGIAESMDARDLVPPFTAGALRGGSHVHLWHPKGDWISFTYEDALEKGARNIGVSVPPLHTSPPAEEVDSRSESGGGAKGIQVPPTHPRNHSGSHYSQLVTNAGTPGSPLLRACEEGWVGSTRSLAFQGEIEHPTHGRIREIFLAELPDALPCPAESIRIRRLTDTTSHRFPGLGGPRHWLKSSPDGFRIGFLKKDTAGVVQFWTVTPHGEIRQVTHNAHPIASAFTWHPDGERVAFVMNGSVCFTDVSTGITRRLTQPGATIRPEACVVSPDGKRIAFVRNDGNNQICVVDVK